VIAWREAAHPVADFGHNAGPFVAADRRRHGRQPEGAQGVRWRRQPALPNVFVGVAEPGGGQPDQDLTGARRIQLELLDGPRPAVFVEDGRAASHRTSATSMSPALAAA
jgi:hypothetical protein